MCKFCENQRNNFREEVFNEIGSKTIGIGKWANVWILTALISIDPKEDGTNDSKLYLELQEHSTKDTIEGLILPIKFCPFCGRELVGVKKSYSKPTLNIIKDYGMNSDVVFSEYLRSRIKSGELKLSDEVIKELLELSGDNEFVSVEDVKDEPKVPEWVFHTPMECYSRKDIDFDAVEKALGFKLFSWQKSFITSGCGYASRRTGKTTAMILFELLDVEGDPIDFSTPALTKRIGHVRSMYIDIWKKLHDAGIETRKVIWEKE